MTQANIIQLQTRTKLHKNLVSWFKISFLIAVCLPTTSLLAFHQTWLLVLLIILSVLAWIIMLILGFTVWKSRNLLLADINTLETCAQK